MDWPSKNVCRGGLLHPAKGTYSQETQDLLQNLMEEAKLTMWQRRIVNESLRNGEPLPLLTSTKKCIKRNPIRIESIVVPQRRSLDTILNLEASNSIDLRPLNLPCRDNAKEKQRLQDKMAFGRQLKESKKRSPNPACTEDNCKPQLNRFDQLMQEVVERQHFLEEMQSLGEGNKYKLIIEQQIQAKIREMKRLKNINVVLE